MRLSEIHVNPDNPRYIVDAKFKKLCSSIQEFPKMMDLRPIIVDERSMILGGNMRYHALVYLGYTDIPNTWVKVAAGLSEEQKKEFIAKDNISFGEWDFDALANIFDESKLISWGLDIPDTEELTKIAQSPTSAKLTLSDKFIVPPFSVLSARDGWWQSRKKAWISLGIESEIGRGSNLAINDQGGMNRLLLNATSGTDFYKKKREYEQANGQISTEEFLKNHYKQTASYDTGTSIFDPVLAELAYRWFTPKNAAILDPFSGGSVRGIVASKLGRRYYGIDLSEEQVKANTRQLRILSNDDPPPTWIHGNSADLDKFFPPVEIDFIFSCPPYGDLEKYSDTPGDISAMDFPRFLSTYRRIIKKSVQRLKNNRFSCFVVGEFRDKGGIYRNFVGETIKAFIDAGMHYYNEAILVTQVGCLPIRAGKQFTASRKIGKTHQNFLVFVKGDPETAAFEADISESFTEFTSKRKVAGTHQNVLVFVKGDPKHATESCGIVGIDDSLNQDGSDG